ncbi:hypothetical protein DN752_17715 [Echinicola strongylocentroti]|uniref:Uncharacterized protein n=1 Tax=Echinicola strongylocentroti TaxID=1795355 RepID=A0A2Z4IM72_9BACT|nr:hypothetical protein [Echinicola strongylocentroti]AWW31819.1 hypothetical protein DN752_17715 [Echinicola strongylocentroti]
MEHHEKINPNIIRINNSRVGLTINDPEGNQELLKMFNDLPVNKSFKSKISIKVEFEKDEKMKEQVFMEFDNVLLQTKEVSFGW